jgi:hypothetical protein
MKEWRQKIPKEIFGAWVAGKEEIIKANRRAIELKENACFEEKALNFIIANNS